MKNLFTSLWRKRRGKGAHNKPLSLGVPHLQSQSLVFSKLPVEIRLRIYHAALVGPNHFLHILHTDLHAGEIDRLGHWRCDDEHNPHLIWQHRCFGQWSIFNEPDTPRTSNTNSRSLSLLLSCRLSYMEAREVLYAQNTFSFCGGRGVTRFQQSLSRPNWQLIRHVHISTIFRTPWKHYMECVFTPENYADWKVACAALRSLENLHSLEIEMVVWNRAEDHDSSPADHDSMMLIFEPLMEVKSMKFDIELNVNLPRSVTKILNTTPFHITALERPFDDRAHIVRF